jgi:hypothetical protein
LRKIVIILYSEVYIYPYITLHKTGRHDAYEYGADDSSCEGWNVQTFGLINGTAGMIDDDDFADKDVAFAYAQALVDRHGIKMIQDAETRNPIVYDD